MESIGTHYLGKLLDCRLWRTVSRQKSVKQCRKYRFPRGVGGTSEWPPEPFQALFSLGGSSPDTTVHMEDKSVYRIFIWIYILLQ